MATRGEPRRRNKEEDQGREPAEGELIELRRRTKKEKQGEGAKSY